MLYKISASQTSIGESQNGDKAAAAAAALAKR